MQARERVLLLNETQDRINSHWVRLVTVRHKGGGGVSAKGYARQSGVCRVIEGYAVCRVIERRRMAPEDLVGP